MGESSSLYMCVCGSIFNINNNSGNWDNDSHDILIIEIHNNDIDNSRLCLQQQQDNKLLHSWYFSCFSALIKGGFRILKWGVNFCNNVREIKYYFNI